MALSATVLRDLMIASIDAAPDKTNRPAVFLAMAQAIVTHIQTSAVVTVASVSGVTAGPGVSGPGVGTIS